MRLDKNLATKLRKKGKSYSEIKRELGIPKSTLSNWVSRYKWSKKIKLFLSEKAKKGSSIRIRELNKIRGEALEKIYKEAVIEAKEEFENLKFHPLFISGVVIYWGEGDKSSKHNVRISNIDPNMIKVFLNFLIKICQVRISKIRASILLYPDLNNDDCKKFWIESAGLKRVSFNKSIVIKGKHKTKKIKHGVCTITVSSRYLKKKILLWLELFPKSLLKNYYLRE